MSRIDSHQHFWRYSAAEYDWINDSMAQIRRDFLPPDLRTELQKTGFDGSVAVQARQTLEETQWLLNLAKQYPDIVRGVVGWVPLASPDLSSLVERLAQNHLLKGVRHVVQGESDDRFILGREFNAGVSRLLDYQLVYDILILERHLPYASMFVDLHPKQVFVLDHIAKPKIKKHELQPWSDQLREIAKRKNVFCKLSGMVTEADIRQWTSGDLEPYIQVVLQAFGPQRILFGSDWPVCLVATSYNQWVSFVKQQIAKLTSAEQAAILGETASRVYRL